MTLRVRARLACHIAGINIDRFNEAVAAGVYPCAPPTLKGQPRIFREADIVGLYIYARLMEGGMNADNAAQIGCGVANRVANMREVGKPDPQRVYYVKAQSGVSWIVDEENANRDANSLAGSPIVFSMSFHVANIIKIIRDEVEEYDSIKGAE